MNRNKILLCALLGCVIGTSYAAKPKTIKEWEECRDQAESSVNQKEVGVSGVEYAIRSKCGDRPAKEPGSTTGAVGMYPWDLVRSKTWKSKFVAITKGKYSSFVERLRVASKTELEGDWVIGTGQAPHMGGIEEAALAINAESGEVYGAMLEDGRTLSGFGFGTSWENAPKFLREWAADHKQ